MRDRGAVANSPAYLSSLAAAVTYPASRARLASSGWTLHDKHVGAVRHPGAREPG
jgi:hypothetical protein